MVTSTCFSPTPPLPLQVHPCNFLTEVDRGGGGQEFYNRDGYWVENLTPYGRVLLPYIFI